MNIIENKQLINEMHPLIKEAVESKFYGLNDESFFIEKIIVPIKKSRSRSKISHGNEDRKLLKSYFKHVAQPFVPTSRIIKEIKFVVDVKNSDIYNEFKNNMYKIMTNKLLMWLINESDEMLTTLLSKSMYEGLNNDKYDVQEIIDNLPIIKDKEKKKKLLSEIYVTKNINNYIILDKYITLSIEDKKDIMHKILINNTESLLLNRDIVKEIFMDKVYKKDWSMIDDYIRNLNSNKIDFLLDILLESKKETTDDKVIKKIDTAIYLIVDKAFYTKKEELIEKMIELKKQQPEITQDDIYILMIKRVYSYLKKNKAQYYCRKIMKVAKENGNFEYIKTILFSNESSYKVENLAIEFDLKGEYFRNEMKQHFMHYLEEKLQPKNSTVKINKI